VRVIKPTEITSTTQFSRASTATYYDLNGIIQTAAIDELRLNYNPSTLVAEGILIEDAATNLFTYSQEFDNAAWIKSRANVTANAETAPDGTLTMDKIIEDTSASNSHFLSKVVTVTAGNSYTYTFFAKAAERSWILVTFPSAQWGSNQNAYFNVGNGVLGTVGSGIEASIELISNGIYKCTVTPPAVTSSGSTSIVACRLATADNSPTYTGDGISGLYLWGCQFELGGSTSYIPTTATAVTRSADVLGNMLTSTVAEPDAGESLWNAATNYAVNDEVMRTTTHKKYINILAGIDATLPEVDAALDTPTRWIESGSTNRYAMFDTLRNTQTITTSPLSVVLTAGRRIDSIGVLAMEADSITISMVNDGVEVYSFTQNLNTRVTLGWYDYFYGSFSSIPSIIKFDLPPYTDGQIMITLTSVNGTVSCGAIVIGNQQYLGQVQYNAVSEEQNFSRIEREFDGTAVLVQRRSIPKINAQLITDKTQTNKIRAARTELNAVPTVWSGLDDLSTDDYFDALLILGIYKRFEIDVAYPEQTIINLELEEI
jgi:hypothetical protein